MKQRPLYHYIRVKRHEMILVGRRTAVRSSGCDDTRSGPPIRRRHRPMMVLPVRYWTMIIIIMMMMQRMDTISCFTTGGRYHDQRPRRIHVRLHQFRFPTINTAENNRIYRRVENTFKDHSYWVRHRRSDRLLHHIRTIPKSIIYQTIRPLVEYISYISTFVVIWNAMSIILTRAVTTTTMFDTSHPLSFLFGTLFKKIPLLWIPIDPLVLTSPMLGLLLVFRTNSCYKRYEEALINWTKAKNQSRNIVRMAKSMTVAPLPGMSTNASMVSQQQQQHSQVVHLAISLWVFARTMKRQLSHADDDEIAYRNEIDHCPTIPSSYRKQLILQVHHRPNYALQYLSNAIEDLSNIPNIRKNEIHAAVTTFEQCLGSNERILSSPVPLFYTRWTVRFLFIWLAVCPFALYTHVIPPKALLLATTATSTSSFSMILMLIRSLMLIPTMYAISNFLLGIDEIANQCEEPFTILPQQNYCNEIYSDCIEIANYDYKTTESAATSTTINDDAIEHVNISNSTIETAVSTPPQQHYNTNNADPYAIGHLQR